MNTFWKCIGVILLSWVAWDLYFGYTYIRTIIYLKNSLNSVVGMSYLVKDEVAELNTVSSTKEIERYLDSISQSGQEMTDLVNNLLRYGTEGIQHKDSTPVAAMLSQACRVLEVLIEESKTTIQQKNTNTEVLVDRALFVQVFTNLISNSIKYKSAEKSPAINIRVEDKGDESIIYVQDNGIGIEEEYLPKVFDRRMRVASVASEVEGHGIGLHTVRSIVKDHGGTIAVQSKVGQGSTFIITLPNKLS